MSRSFDETVAALWLEPWHQIAGEHVVAIERELRRELAEGHALYGLPVRALARRQDCDDVLFAIEDGSGRVAVVHLTWISAPPERALWPSTTFFASLDAWIVEGMRPDHDDFADG